MALNSSDLFPENPNIIYMGTPDFSVRALKSLVSKGYKVSAVVTQPDRPRGRGRNVSFSSVKKAALDFGLKVLQPENIKNRAFIDELRGYSPDIFVVTAFGQILNSDLLAIPRYAAINIHASLLPKYRGAAPIQWAILNNDDRTGISIMKMDRGLDAGPILMKEAVPIEENETAGELFDRLARLSGDVILKFLKNAVGKELKAEAQDNALASYASKITRDMAVINWEADALKVSSLIRAMDPSPGAVTTMEGKKIKLFSPHVIDSMPLSGMPGKVIIDKNDRFLVETGSGNLEIGEIQLPGKKRIAVRDFLMGNVIKEGTVLE